MAFRFPARWDGVEGEPNPLAAAAAARRASGQGLLDLTVSNPTMVGLALPRDWTGAWDEDESLHRYEADPKGLLPVREAIAGYYNERDPGEGVDPGDLVLTAGTSEGYSHLFRLLAAPGDEVLVPRPSYPLLEALAGLADLRLRDYALHPDRDWRPDREAVEAGITDHTRVICVVQPNNPTGSVLAVDDVAWLLDLAGKHDLALIVDEVFADYRHDGGRTPRMRSPGPLVFTLNGLSKLVGLPQLKLAWINVDGAADDKARAREKLEWIADAHLSVGAAPQLAAPELLRRRAEFQEPIRARLAENLAILRALAAAHPRLRPLWPRGGWCVPVRCAARGGAEDDEALAIRLVEREGVLVQPGYFFDFEDEETVVISLLPEPAHFRAGVEALAKALD